MQLPGPGVFGPPADRAQALAVLRRAVDAGVDHIDTAQFYGPDVANELVHEALFPYPEELVLVSKVGAARDDDGHWLAAQRPEELRAGVEANLRSLELEQVPVVNLRRHPDSDVPFAEQLDTMIALRDEGLIGAVGLSNVTLDDYRTARSRTDVACVQNAYNVRDRSGQPVFEACRADAVPFVPFFPLGSGVPPGQARAERARGRSRAPAASTPPRPRWPWRGCWPRHPRCCSSPERRRSHTWRRTWPAGDLVLDEEALASLDLAGGS